MPNNRLLLFCNNKHEQIKFRKLLQQEHEFIMCDSTEQCLYSLKNFPNFTSIICDVSTIEELKGFQEFFDEILALGNKKLKIIIIINESQNTAFKSLKSNKQIKFLQKPFSGETFKTNL